ncbi:hypothetical protein [Granulicella sp. dw_53]|uniref:hypothetical protein n=1 Tax=Granulicella sp. dw_53 TaxID=2719792 RepID=UPI0021042EDA|nr:hypothetical protein [Granulicella sp. dw_53]
MAWLRRWPNAGPPGGAREATSFFGVNRLGVSHPAVYAKEMTTTPTTAAMTDNRVSGKFPGDKGDWGIETSFQSILFFYNDYVAGDSTCKYTVKAAQTFACHLFQRIVKKTISDLNEI